jgi:hypothetical protein
MDDEFAFVIWSLLGVARLAAPANWRRASWLGKRLGHETEITFGGTHLRISERAES